MRSPFALRRVKDRSSQVRMRRKTLGAAPGIRLWGGCLASRRDLVLYLGLLSLAGASLAPSTLRCTQRLNRLVSGEGLAWISACKPSALTAATASRLGLRPGSLARRTVQRWSSASLPVASLCRWVSRAAHPSLPPKPISPSLPPTPHLL